jgi:hypothetical protein
VGPGTAPAGTTPLPSLQHWVPGGLLLQLLLLAGFPLLLQLLLLAGFPLLLQLLLAGVLQQQEEWVVPDHLLQLSDAAASWQLLPAFVAVLGLPCDAAGWLPTEHVAVQQLLPARGLARGLVVVVTASAGQTAAAVWRRLLLQPLMQPQI